MSRSDRHASRPVVLLAAGLSLAVVTIPAVGSAQDRPADATHSVARRSPLLFALGGSLVLAGYATTVPASFLSDTSEAGLLPVFGGFFGGAFALAHAGEPSRSTADALRASTLGYVQIAASAVQTVGLVLLVLGLRPTRAVTAVHPASARWLFVPQASSQTVGASVCFEAF